MDYLNKYKQWCKNSYFDEETKKELEEIKGNEEEIKDRFYKELEFGTGGLRGIVGAGTNRMNKYTVGKATQGLANFIKKKKGELKGVAIAYDSRNMSKEFSEQVALILNANGIKTYLFEEVTPTPVLSFAVRELKCISGIVITASHNPPKYNGYKVYWEDGAQIVAPVDEAIIKCIKNIKDYSKIKSIDKKLAQKLKLYNVVGEEIYDKYIEQLKKLSLNSDIDKSVKIVYTPLHGTGLKMAKRILNESGFKNVFVVSKQEKPDGKFPTVKFPNPEDPEAFKLALELAKKEDADIVLANDPDADRIGMYVKNKETGEYILFNGNMTGLIIAEYIICQQKSKGILAQNSALIKTIVSSTLTDKICETNKVRMFEVLTGFKNIAQKIRQFEDEQTYKCIMGFEESFGCLLGNHARDKDGIAALILLCETAGFYKKQKLTLWDAMKLIYEKYGYYREDQMFIVLEGADGAKKIKKMMENIRNNPPKQINGIKIIAVEDYSDGTVTKISNGRKYKKDLPKSNVLRFKLQDDSWFAARPSGTEPKIKFYAGVKGENLEDADEKLKHFMEGIKELIKE